MADGFCASQHLNGNSSANIGDQASGDGGSRAHTFRLLKGAGDKHRAYAITKPLAQKAASLKNLITSKASPTLETSPIIRETTIRHSLIKSALAVLAQ